MLFVCQTAIKSHCGLLFFSVFPVLISGYLFKLRTILLISCLLVEWRLTAAPGSVHLTNVFSQPMCLLYCDLVNVPGLIMFTTWDEGPPKRGSVKSCSCLIFSLKERFSLMLSPFCQGNDLIFLQLIITWLVYPLQWVSFKMYNNHSFLWSLIGCVKMRRLLWILGQSRKRGQRRKMVRIEAALYLHPKATAENTQLMLTFTRIINF